MTKSIYKKENYIKEIQDVDNTNTILLSTPKNNEFLIKMFTEIFDERFKPIRRSLQDLAKKVR